MVLQAENVQVTSQIWVSISGADALMNDYDLIDSHEPEVGPCLPMFVGRHP